MSRAIAGQGTAATNNSDGVNDTPAAPTLENAHRVRQSRLRCVHVHAQKVYEEERSKTGGRRDCVIETNRQASELRDEAEDSESRGRGRLRGKLRGLKERQICNKKSFLLLCPSVRPSPSLIR